MRWEGCDGDQKGRLGEKSSWEEGSPSVYMWHHKDFDIHRKGREEEDVL
jgi:hypothetical protein